MALVQDVEAIQKQLSIMLHAIGCMRKNEPDACKLKHCGPMKLLLKHVKKCRQPDCKAPNCPSARRMIKHWNRCSADTCNICVPLRIGTKAKEAARINASKNANQFNISFDSDVSIMDKTDAHANETIGNITFGSNVKTETIGDTSILGMDISTERGDNKDVRKSVNDPWDEFVNTMNELASKAKRIDQVNSIEYRP